MALIEKKIVDSIELVESNHIQVRTSTIIEKDGVEIARTFHRHVLSPGDDISKEDLRVQLIANAIWTDEVIANYKALLSKDVLKIYETISEEIRTSDEIATKKEI